MARELIQDEGFILHSHAWKESSYILRAFTREHGRVSLVGRGLRGGAKNPPVLAGQLYRLQWRAGSDLGSLSTIEMNLPQSPGLVGESWWASQYLSELVLYGVAEAETVPKVYSAFQKSLNELRQPDVEAARVLRRFEWALLVEAGLGFDLKHDAEGLMLVPEWQYELQVDAGLVRCNRGGFSGAEWHTLVEGELTLELAKRLRHPMQQQLGLLIDWRKMKTREMWQAARRLSQKHQQNAHSNQ